MVIIVALAASGIVISCGDYPRNQSHPEISNASIRKGAQLAAQYCQSCHLLPSPALLDTKTWEDGVLPAMGPFLGIFRHLYHKYPSGKNDPNLDAGFYPSQPALKPEDWQHIINYYIATSPDSLALPGRETITESVPGFTATASTLQVASPTSSYIKIDTATHQLLLADLFKQRLYRFNSNLQLMDSVTTGSAIVDAEPGKKSMLLCNIGELNPNNKKLGTAGYLAITPGSRLTADTTTFLRGLARPVQVTAADFNHDSIADYLVCEFGFLQGSLSIYNGKAGNTFTKQVLRPFPGATKAYLQDYNNDGLTDIWTLFGQGDEGIFLFTNKGNGAFEQRQVLRFPPSYGSTFFEMVDFNKDGYQDIVYTCGDNADYSQVFKPYHGIYVFLNDGNNNFSQHYFHHMNGCYKALARDYDNDGDMDIAAISFFADYSRQPDEGFLYLQNTGGNNFKPFTLPTGHTGRWLTLDAGDLDGDGKTDLALGNFTYGPVMFPTTVDWTKGASFVFLKNVGNQ
ncbi:FG-GAP-like repeat-containing protein [Foetidibacter luteolus]|uniref:FG-GAP-like repeat-containing protein n=1 Tax=Foetidibacter luteolus TaxID=2608880 RepID=UPI001F407421|nr:FG-GAP-like repeat-containing protein [Foetidibacter luteolus]